MRAKQFKREAASTIASSPGYFDAEEVLETEIQPLLERIRAAALDHGMPFVLAVGYGNTPESGFATASAVCTLDERTGAELYVAAKILSNPVFAHHVMELLEKAGEATTNALRETRLPAERLM